MSNTWQSPIGDTCRSLIGPLMSSLTRARLLVSLLTRVELLVSSLTRVGCVIGFCMTLGKFLLASE